MADTTAALVPRTFVALTPQDVAPAQAGLADWCREKMRALGKEYAELTANLRIAKRNRWSRGGIISARNRTKALISYYQQIRAAVRAGYLLVPNFDVEIMAVRVDAEQSAETKSFDTTSPWSKPLFEEQPQQLALGAGKYVGPRQGRDYYTEKQKDDQGKEEKHYVWRSTGYRPPEFPVALVKPIVLEATERAMSLKIFDQIGVVTGRKKDPIVVGQILRPKGGVVSFFIAWWLDTESL